MLFNVSMCCYLLPDCLEPLVLIAFRTNVFTPALASVLCETVLKSSSTTPDAIYISELFDFRKDKKMALIQMSSVEEACHALMVGTSLIPLQTS